ncbi:hypothetical protein THAOC_35223 [Thalassiosira oceanica]|uniref:Uncharacterized protein n=1 Tax=Thalassiosira oceanica TaxID=159749 RepID=K0R3R7_THAOC|nr:hypothetical protein THAOC_35223 [Thalassiosira oceanica]|eukprot:EJK46129.1 hypothetical protein THAOC_35223 [Thalassiosira oceanica]
MSADMNDKGETTFPWLPGVLIHGSSGAGRERPADPGRQRAQQPRREMTEGRTIPGLPGVLIHGSSGAGRERPADPGRQRDRDDPVADSATGANNPMGMEIQIGEGGEEGTQIELGGALAQDEEQNEKQAPTEDESVGTFGHEEGSRASEDPNSSFGYGDGSLASDASYEPGFGGDDNGDDKDSEGGLSYNFDQEKAKAGLEWGGEVGAVNKERQKRLTKGPAGDEARRNARATQEYARGAIKGFHDRAGENVGGPGEEFGRETSSHVFVTSVFSKNGEVAVMDDSENRVRKTDGKWVVVRVGNRDDCSDALNSNLKELSSPKVDMRHYLPTAKSGGGGEIPENKRFIEVRVAAVNVGEAEFKAIVAEYAIADQTAADELLHKAVVMKDLVVDEDVTRVVATGLDGKIHKKYPSLHALMENEALRITISQLNASVSFQTNSCIKDDDCGYTIDGTRFVYSRNKRFIIQAFDEKDHGEWSKIRKGIRNPSYRLIPTGIIEGWGRMAKRTQGRQSLGGVYELDQDRKVIKYKDSWKGFKGVVTGWGGISVDDLKDAGRGGKEINGRTYVHATCCEGKRYEEGETLSED